MGGPFADIAHGCTSVIATRTALELADYVVTEAGFGADLGAEKFFDIKCRKAGLKPDATVMVATVRALKMHGGVGKDELGRENVAAVTAGCANLARHLENIKTFGVPVVVAINRFINDTEAELEAIGASVREQGAAAVVCTHWADGGAGTQELAEHVIELVESGAADFKPLYEDSLPLWDKVERIATRIYGAAGIAADARVRKTFDELQGTYGHFPVCMAKTQYSLSADPGLKGAPSGHVVPIREVRVSGGAGFVVVVTGAIMTMPGLPRVPAADNICLDDQGRIEGLF